MAGSVKEWTRSRWTSESDYRVMRGGCVHPVAVALGDPEEASLSAQRLARADPATVRIPGVGFRLARDAGAPK